MTTSVKRRRGAVTKPIDKEGVDPAHRLIANKIRHLMRARRMTQADLAERIGSVQSRIHKWIHCIGEPRPGHLLQLSKVFNVSLEYFCDATIPVTANLQHPLTTDEVPGSDQQLLNQLIERLGPDVVLARLIGKDDATSTRFVRASSSRILPKGPRPRSSVVEPLGHKNGTKTTR